MAEKSWMITGVSSGLGRALASAAQFRADLDKWDATTLSIGADPEDR